MSIHEVEEPVWVAATSTTHFLTLYRIDTCQCELYHSREGNIYMTVEEFVKMLSLPYGAVLKPSLDTSALPENLRHLVPETRPDPT